MYNKKYLVLLFLFLLPFILYSQTIKIVTPTKNQQLFTGNQCTIEWELSGWGTGEKEINFLYIYFDWKNPAGDSTHAFNILVPLRATRANNIDITSKNSYTITIPDSAQYESIYSDYIKLPSEAIAYFIIMVDEWNSTHTTIVKNGTISSDKFFVKRPINNTTAYKKQPIALSNYKKEFFYTLQGSSISNPKNFATQFLLNKNKQTLSQLHLIIKN